MRPRRLKVLSIFRKSSKLTICKNIPLPIFQNNDKLTTIRSHYFPLFPNEVAPLFGISHKTLFCITDSEMLGFFRCFLAVNVVEWSQ